MYSVGDKVISNPGIIGEIICLYPLGQAGAKENSYELIMNGTRLRIKESDLNNLFSLSKKKAPKKESVKCPQK